MQTSWPSATARTGLHFSVDTLENFRLYPPSEEFPPIKFVEWCIFRSDGEKASQHRRAYWYRGIVCKEKTGKVQKTGYSFTS